MNKSASGDWLLLLLSKQVPKLNKRSYNMSDTPASTSFNRVGWLSDSVQIAERTSSQQYHPGQSYHIFDCSWGILYFLLHLLWSGEYLRPATGTLPSHLTLENHTWCQVVMEPAIQSSFQDLYGIGWRCEQPIFALPSFELIPQLGMTTAQQQRTICVNLCERLLWIWRAYKL